MNICKCGSIAVKRSKNCRECMEKNKVWKDVRLGDVIYKNHHRAAAFALVRYRARATLLKQGIIGCSRCPYNKHFEVSHIKPIASFHEDTMISVINSPDNIIALCPNCHWEADFGNRPPKKKKVVVYKGEKPKPIKTKQTIEYVYKERKTKIQWPEKEELEKLVWEKPLTKVAIELGVSDKGIKRWCKKLGIETPKYGYWLKGVIPKHIKPKKRYFCSCGNEITRGAKSCRSCWRNSPQQDSNL